MLHKCKLVYVKECVVNYFNCYCVDSMSLFYNLIKHIHVWCTCTLYPYIHVHVCSIYGVHVHLYPYIHVHVCFIYGVHVHYTHTYMSMYVRFTCMFHTWFTRSLYPKLNSTLAVIVHLQQVIYFSRVDNGYESL